MMIGLRSGCANAALEQSSRVMMTVGVRVLRVITNQAFRMKTCRLNRGGTRLERSLYQSSAASLLAPAANGLTPAVLRMVGRQIFGSFHIFDDRPDRRARGVERIEPRLSRAPTRGGVL